MNIQISNHPEFPTVSRKYQIPRIVIDLNDVDEFSPNVVILEGSVQNFNSEGKTPLDMNPNGRFEPLRADNTTRVNSATGADDENGDIGEVDFLGNLNAEFIASQLGVTTAQLTLNMQLAYAISANVFKRDMMQRFNK